MMPLGVSMDEPIQEAELTAKAKRSRGFAGYVGWGFLAVVLYLLSYGPVRLMGVKGMYPLATKRVVNQIYAPFIWTYNNTPLHKPLGMYLHLWCPDIYEQNGESFDIVGPTKYDRLQEPARLR
jgi:hypothetical protein